MQKEKKEKHFLQKPVYPGGNQKMKSFIASHLKYPEEARAHNINGIVNLELTISHQGDVIHTKIIKGLGYGCDEEAIRVAKLLKFHVPKNRGVKVRFFKKLNFYFKLAEPKPPSKQNPVEPNIPLQPLYYNIQYITNSKPSKESAQQTAKYSITINLTNSQDS